MSFLWPVMFVLLLLIPLFVWLYIRQRARRRQLIAKSGSFGLVQRGYDPGFRRHIPPILFLLSFVMLIAALARPQTVISLPRIEGTVILAFDVSGSMAADDMKPTRMEAAKVAAQDFVQRQPNTVQIGVVAFSDGGLSAQIPTNDQGAVLAAINRLTPQRGTSLANGILTSLNIIASMNQPTHFYSNLTPTPAPSPTPMPQGTYTSAVIVLLTDGENNENPDPMTVVQDAADRGVRIYTVGIGSPEGTNLHINGFTVHTQLDETTLQKIAQVTGGTYYNAESAQDLKNIYDNLSPQLVLKSEQTELTGLFAGVSILVLLVGGLCSLLWFSRLP